MPPAKKKRPPQFTSKENENFPMTCWHPTNDQLMTYPESPKKMTLKKKNDFERFWQSWSDLGKSMTIIHPEHHKASHKNNLFSSCVATWKKNDPTNPQKKKTTLKDFDSQLVGIRRILENRWQLSEKWESWPTPQPSHKNNFFSSCVATWIAILKIISDFPEHHKMVAFSRMSKVTIMFILFTFSNSGVIHNIYVIAKSEKMNKICVDD